MGILTVLKANIRHKKGSFISIALLMFLVSMSLTAILSVKDICRESMEAAHAMADTYDLTVAVSDRRLTEELRRAVWGHPLAGRVEDCHCVAADMLSIGENEHSNLQFITELPDNARLVHPDGTAYEGAAPALSEGEIYVPQGLLTVLHGKVGDTVLLQAMGRDYRFTVKGIVLEPLFGASTIGYKRLFVNGEDLKAMFTDAKEAETEEKTADYHLLMVDKADGCGLTDAQFRRKLNLDTGITDNGTGSLTKDLSMHYTGLFPEIISAILMVFIVLLVCILLIVMGHGISSEIEMDYVNLGILKSYGFGQGRIRLVFVLQYTLAQMLGAVLGMAAAVPLIRPLSHAFWLIIAVVPANGVSVFKSLAVVLAVMAVSGLFILAITGKVGKISPVRAVSGGRGEIYFDSRIKVPICGRGLLASLALRQVTSGRRRYVASVLVAAILVFFMVTVTLLSNAVTSKSAVTAMGEAYGECGFYLNKQVEEGQFLEFEKTVEGFSPIEAAYYTDYAYFSIDGEEIMCVIYRDPEGFVLLKGRAPLYENEIVINDILAEDMGLEMGDEVAVGYQENKEPYLISGIFQKMNDAGMCIGMGISGAKRLGRGTTAYVCYSLARPEMAKEAADALNAAYGDLLEAAVRENLLDESYGIAIRAMKWVIFSFSVLFALVIVQMVCAKAFWQERTDIGIYKAVGFTAGALRLQFAVRFLAVAALGSVMGVALAMLCSAKLLGILLRKVGISSFSAELTAAAAAVPALLICACFFIFALWASGRIRRVAVRELVTE